MEQFQRNGALIFLSAALFLAASCTSPATHADSVKQEETLVLRNLARSGDLEIENRGPAINLSGQLIVQQLDGTTWRDNAIDLLLLETCTFTIEPGCKTLEHGATLRPAHWNGMSCAGQCPQGCRANIFLGPGQFRFVFTLPDHDHSELKKK